MKYDIIVSGVGGQGVLSISAIIASSAMQEGLSVKQSEVHGMSQRGGAVVANLRLSDKPIQSDLIPHGTASLIISMEPLEGPRYLSYLSPDATLVSSTNPVVNIPNYPQLDGLLAKLRELKKVVLVDAEKIARDKGSAQAVNMVMVGAASPLLPLKIETLEQNIRTIFARKGERVVDINLQAFRAGREAAQ